MLAIRICLAHVQPVCCAAEAYGAPEDMLKDPFADTRVLDFVTDPAKGEPRFAGVENDPYGGGRHLLLPLFRRMQYQGSRYATLSSFS